MKCRFVNSHLVVGSRAVVDSLPVAGKCWVGIPPAAGHIRLVDSHLGVDRSHPVGILLAVVLDHLIGSCLVGDNYPADSLPAEVVDHLVGNLLAVGSRRTDVAGWGLVPGQDSNSYYCSSFLENERVVR